MSRLPVFELRDIAFTYGNVNALSSLSLRIDPGERIALLGANGSGKSTLLKLMDALYFPAGGEIRYQGETLSEARFEDEPFSLQFRRQVSLVFQNPDVQLFCPTVLEEIAFGPLQLRWPKEDIRQRAGDIMDVLQIGHLRDRAPHHLSGGEKKKVALASVLVLDPQVLLLDEPTAALDPRSQEQIIDFISHWSGGSKTIITATHDLQILEEIADRCLLFDSGQIIASARPSELLRDRHLLQRSNLIRSSRRSFSLMQGDLHR